MDQENNFPAKIRALTEDARVNKENNRNLKAKLVEADRTNRNAHENMVRLEQTVRELKIVVQEQAAGRAHAVKTTEG